MNTKYPFKTMAVGEKFQRPVTPTNILGVRSYIYTVGKKLGRKFATKKVGDNLEITRVE